MRLNLSQWGPGKLLLALGIKDKDYLGHACVLLANLVCWVTAYHFYKKKMHCQVPFSLFVCFFMEQQEHSCLTSMWGWDAEFEYEYTGTFKAETSVVNKSLRERESFCILNGLLSRKLASDHSLRTSLQEIPCCTDSKTPTWCHPPWPHLTPSCGHLFMSEAGTVTHFHTTEHSCGMSHRGYKHYRQMGVGLASASISYSSDLE